MPYVEKSVETKEFKQQKPGKLLEESTAHKEMMPVEEVIKIGRVKQSKPCNFIKKSVKHLEKQKKKASRKK